MRRKPQGQVAALEATLKALGDRLEDTDEALVMMARGLASAIDADPSNAALWREYRAALVAVKEAGADGSDDDTASFLFTVQTPRRRTKVGDPPKP